MAYAYPYAGSPAYYDYSTSASNSPAPDERFSNIYLPQYQTPTPTPGKRHMRTASYHIGPRAYAAPAQYVSPTFYNPNFDYTSPPQHADYVSMRRSSTTSHKTRQSVDDAYARLKASTRSPPKQRVFRGVPDNASDQSEDERPQVFEIRPGRRASTTIRRPVSNADPRFFQTYDTCVDTPVRSRARRATASAGSTPKKATAAPRVAKQGPATREATASDARRHNIPAGFSLKNWDPAEEPILLLGSAFDGNSLGKWIYDWTVYHHTAGAPMTDVAGELWLLLIKFSGKMKRGEECQPRVRNPENRELLDKFLHNGDRIWTKLKKLLRICEDHMWKGARKEGGKVSMGEKAGVEFVKTIFGMERELDRTETLMNSIRMWNMQFDNCCEDILRRPSAK